MQSNVMPPRILRVLLSCHWAGLWAGQTALQLWERETRARSQTDSGIIVRSEAGSPAMVASTGISFCLPWVNSWPCKTTSDCGRTGLDPRSVAFAGSAVMSMIGRLVTRGTVRCGFHWVCKPSRLVTGLVPGRQCSFKLQESGTVAG